MEGRGAEGEQEEAWTGICTVVAVDPTSMWYPACSTCERPLPENKGSGAAGPAPCRFCKPKSVFSSAKSSRLLYRISLSVATEDRVVVVICFDRAARALLGCSANEFDQLCNVYPCGAKAACEILKGEIFCMTLTTPRNAYAENFRVSSLDPIRSTFRPVIETVNKMYWLNQSSSAHAAGSS